MEIDLFDLALSLNLSSLTKPNVGGSADLSGLCVNLWKVISTMSDYFVTLNVFSKITCPSFLNTIEYSPTGSPSAIPQKFSITPSFT